MPIRLVCDICGAATSDCAYLPLFKATGIFNPTALVCGKCLAGRKKICRRHKLEMVFFIDATCICPKCVEDKARESYHLDPKSYEDLFLQLSGIVGEKDSEEFVSIMRVATFDDATFGQCLAFGLESFAQRMKKRRSVSFRYARIIIAKSRTFYAILPSSDPAKRGINLN